MCFFLAIAVPAVKAYLVTREFGRGFQTAPAGNASLRSMFPASFDRRWILSGGCSCGMYARPSSADDVAKQSRAAASTSGFSDDFKKRFAAICRSAGAAAVILHWYDGDVEKERVAPGRVVRCRCKEVESRLFELREDELLIATA